MNILLKEAMDKYDFCIRKYQSEGKKKYRTLEVRRAELSLCTDSNHYIEILNQYEKFEHYAAINDITVFEGYCNTQKGKAFALYADYMLRCNDIDRYEEYLKRQKIICYKLNKFMRNGEIVMVYFALNYCPF